MKTTITTSETIITRTLTEQDREALETYKIKTEELKAFTLACIRGTHTGLLLFGAGGNGKSYSIREMFKQEGIVEASPRDEGSDEEPAQADYRKDIWVSHQGRITAKGLVKQMSLYPNAVHLVEDSETMFDDKNCWGVLRMALHSQDQGLHGKRRITWRVSTKDSYDFFFAGSLIIVGNRRLPVGNDEVEAVKTRCPVLTFDISNDELTAKMKEICERGYDKLDGYHLSKNDCYDVLSFLLNARKEDTGLAGKKLNLRILNSGFSFMALSRMDNRINWKDMVMSQLKELVGANKPLTKAAKLETEADTIGELMAKGLKGWKLWSEIDKAMGKTVAWDELKPGTPEYDKHKRRVMGLINTRKKKMR